MPIYPTHGFTSTSIPGTGEFPLLSIWFPALGIGDNRVYTPFIYVSSSHCLIAGYEDKIRTRSYLHFLIFLNFCIFVLYRTATRSVSPSVLSAANRHQYSDRTLIRTDQQPEFQPVLHHYAGRIIYFIRIQSMDAFIDTLIQLLIDWDIQALYLGLIGGKHHSVQFRAGDAGTRQGRLEPAICVLAATLGNTMGGMTCYYMGHLGKTDWIEKYFKVKARKNRQNAAVSCKVKERSCFLCLSALYRRSHCHSTGIYAQQRNADFPFHVYRKTDTVHRYVIGSSSALSVDECLAVGN